MKDIPRMVPLAEASKLTGVCYERLRQLCLQNKIVHIRSGKKYLVNLDKFIDYLNGERD